MCSKKIYHIHFVTIENLYSVKWIAYFAILINLCHLYLEVQVCKASPKRIWQPFSFSLPCLDAIISGRFWELARKRWGLICLCLCVAPTKTIFPMLLPKRSSRGKRLRQKKQGGFFFLGFAVFWFEAAGLSLRREIPSEFCSIWRNYEKVYIFVQSGFWH